MLNDKQKVVKSSIIQTYEYDADKYILTVTFKTGDTWTYKDVKPSVMSSVFDSPASVGSKFIKLIRNGKYPATKS